MNKNKIKSKKKLTETHDVIIWIKINLINVYI